MRLPTFTLNRLSAGGWYIKSYGDGREVKRQVLDCTGSRSLKSARRRLRCMGRLLLTRGNSNIRQHPGVTKQPSLGTALLAPNGDRPRKGGPIKACLALTWLASRGQRASHQCGKKQLKRTLVLRKKYEFIKCRIFFSNEHSKFEQKWIIHSRDMIFQSFH